VKLCDFVGHPSHIPLQPTELRVLKELTQSVSIGAVFAAQSIEATLRGSRQDYDVFDRPHDDRQTALALLAAANAGSVSDPCTGHSVLLLRETVAARMVPNYLRPLADWRVFGFLAVSLMLLGWWTIGGHETVWVLLLLGLLWALGPTLPVQYQADNFARLTETQHARLLAQFEPEDDVDAGIEELMASLWDVGELEVDTT
jgi:hypothetical protein